MKKLYYLMMVCVLMGGLFSSCDDDDYIPTLPIVGFTQGNYSMELTDSIVFKAEVTNALENTFNWTLDNAEVSSDEMYVFKAERSGTYELSLTASNSDGSTTHKAIITVNPGKYKYGTFILNEGLIGTHGSLIYISPGGEITPRAYQKENGKYLWELTQDLFIADGKLYIIAQRGTDDSRNDGALTILNAETLKEEFSYSFPSELGFNSPTHIAVLGEDDVYIRDVHNNVGGISVFHPSDSTAQFISGSEGARHNTLAVASGKVFAGLHKEPIMIVMEKGKNEVSARIQFDGLISGIIKSSDGKLWVSDETGKISKVDPDTYEIIAANQLTGEAAKRLIRNPESKKTASPQITAKGDTLYMSSTTTSIYAHIFSLNKTLLAVDAKYYIPASPDYFTGTWSMVYNTCAVNPTTGEVFLNTIKGIGGERHNNHISVFDFTWGRDFFGGTTISTTLNRDYANYTDYPTNVYFTHSFK